MTTKKPSPTAGKSSALAGKQKTTTPAKGTTLKARPAPQSADGATLADILAVLKGIDAKLGTLVPKPLEKL